MEEPKKKLLVFIIVLILVWFLVKHFYAQISPLKPLQLASESMSPTYNKEDVIFYVKTTDFSINDVVIFYSLKNEFIMARIIEINPDGTYKLKGDNPITNPVPIKNQFLDETSVTKDKTIGKPVFSLNPYLFFIIFIILEILIAKLISNIIYDKFLTSKKRIPK